MSESLQVDLSEAHHGEDYDSTFEFDSNTERKREKRADLARNEKEPPKGKAEKSVFVDEYNREEGRNERFHLLALDAYARHKKLINDYVLYYSGATELLRRDTSGDRTDLDIIRENHRFLWSDEDDTATWGKRIAKKYYAKLFKEYALADLSRYKENMIALRWRVEKEVVDGKGQFICGNKVCMEKEGLRSWEVNFAYMENSEKKHALVKLRLCSECSYRLNYYHQKKEVNAKKRLKHSSKKTGDVPPSKTMKTGEFSKSERSSEGIQSLEGNLTEDRTEGAESVLWKGPVQVDDKSRDDEFDDYFEDLFL